MKMHQHCSKIGSKIPYFTGECVFICVYTVKTTQLK